MKMSRIYSYRNSKKIWFAVPRFIILKKEKDLDNLIDKLLEIDAVCDENISKFPCLVEIKDKSFGPEIKFISAIKDLNVSKVNITAL